MKNKIQINIFTNNLVWMGAIDDVKSFVHRSSWNEIVNSELTISRKAAGIDEMQVGRILIVNNELDKVLIIEEKSANLADDSWNFVLIPLKGLMNYRIAHPTDSGSFAAMKQSEIMMRLAYQNLYSQFRDQDRKFWDETGTTNLFSVAAFKQYGDVMDFTTTWETGLLGDAIIEISKMFEDTPGKFPIGWNVYIKPTMDGYELDTYLYTNRTIHQTLQPPVVFSEAYNNIKDATYTKSIKDWVSMGFVIWNDGTNDQTTAVASKKHERVIGFDRKENILDSDKKTAAEAANDGRAEINRRPIVESFTAEIINNPNTMSTYGVDWFLGDVVTVQSKELVENQMISLDAQIIEVEETFDSGEYSINATFGMGRLSFLKLIKHEIRRRK